MNPTLIIIALVSAGVIAFGADQFGYNRGITEQKVADQKVIDEVNVQLEANKAEAARILLDRNTEILALVAARDQAKNVLEAEREKTRQSDAADRAKYNALSLRFKSVKNSASRDCGTSTGGAGIDPAAAESTEVVQLPDQVAGDLRQLAFDAQELNGDYAKCYAFAQQIGNLCQPVKKWPTSTPGK